jgi:uncharacterized protein YgiM (DUF1202 family)
MKKTWRKILMIVCALLMIIPANPTVFAALDMQNLNETRQKSSENIPYDWPIAAHCSATDVNLRSAPSTDSEVLGTLQNGNQVYVEEVSDVQYEGYPWVAITTAQGSKGYVNARFLDADADAMSRKERFKAMFNSTVFWTFDYMANAFNGIYGNGNLMNSSENGFHDTGKYKVSLGNNSGYSYGKIVDNAYEQATVRIMQSDYWVAGLTVGDVMDAAKLAQFDADMQSMGWRHGAITSDSQKWYLDGQLDGKTAAIKGFFLVLDKDNKIKEINWQRYLID